MRAPYLFFFLLIALQATAQREAGSLFLAGGPNQKHFQTTIQIELGDHYVFLPVSIQGKTYRFIFDTGASNTIRPTLATQLGLETISDSVAINDINQQTVQSNWVRLPAYQLGEVTFEASNFWSLASPIYDLMGIDGIIGSNAFEGLVVQVDKASQQLTVTDKLSNLDLKKKNGQVMALTPYQLLPFVNVYFDSCQDQKQGILFDSGSNDFYTMSIEEWTRSKQAHPTWKALTTTTSNSIVGIGGHFHDTTTHHLFELPELRLDHLCFGPTQSNTTAATTSSIGSGLFCYGKVTIDYKHKRFFLEPYAKDRYTACREHHNQKNELGVGFTWVEDHLEVAAIWKDWPADKAGLQSGMVVLEVNGKAVPTQKEDWPAFLLSAWRSAGKGLILLLRREDGQTQRYDLQ